MSTHLTLILGGVRSGKTRMAMQMATDSGQGVSYIATATAGDAEMQARIDQHRQQRPDHWQTLEAPIRLADALTRASGPCLLVDCLTLWLTNLLTCDDKQVLMREREALIHVLPSLTGPVVLVSNESNMGVTPLGELSRRYCDEIGILHQQLAQRCDRVVLMVAGLPHLIKGEPL